MVNKMWHYSAGWTVLHMFDGHYSTWDWTVHILCKSNFCVKKILSLVHNAWNRTKFDQLAAALGFISSINRYSNNTEIGLFGVCFAILMCIQTDVVCCMTETKGNNTVLEAQQCKFWTLYRWFMETSLFVDYAWLLTIGLWSNPSWFKVLLLERRI